MFCVCAPVGKMSAAASARDLSMGFVAAPWSEIPFCHEAGGRNTRLNAPHLIWPDGPLPVLRGGQVIRAVHIAEPVQG